MREADVLRQCLDLLALRKIRAWRCNTGATKVTAVGHKPRFVRFGTPGQPDILGLLRPGGRLLCVECKGPSGRLTDEQRAWLDAARAEGALTLVVRDVTELAAALDAAGV